MSQLDAATLAALLETFFEESFEGLERAETSLLAIEHDHSDERIGELFRAIHSIKGGAGAFGVTEVTELAHVMENLLDEIRSGRAATREITAALLQGVDTLRVALVARRRGKPVDPASHAPIVAQLVALRGGPVAAAPTATAQTSSAPWRIAFTPHAHMMRAGNDPLRMLRELAALGGTVIATDLSRLPPLAQLDPTAIYLAWTLRVPGSVARAEIDDIFAWVEGDCDLTIEREVVAAAVAAVATAVDQASTPPPPPTMGSLRVGIDKIDLLMNMVGELVITQSMLGELDDEGPITVERIRQIREGLSLLARTTRALQESVVRLRSMPVGQVFGRFPRLVHDLGQQLGKDIAIEITGQSTELDRTVLEKLGDPLVHIVRNSIDHGLETPEQRVAAGKPAQGTIRLHAEHRGSAVVIEISDDGRGLDLPRILELAKQRGLVAADAQPSDAEIAKLIFAPGFSTARTVSDISGRGVGMDVVWRSIQELHGEVSVETHAGRGTRTVLSLPLTLAIIDGQLIRLGTQTYVVPLLSIVETVEAKAQTRHRYGAGQVTRLRDQIVPIVDIAAELGIRPRGASDSDLLMIVEADGGPLGLVVDELLAQQQVVIKSLETNFGRVDGLAGATILGDGRVAFILDIAALSRDIRHAA